MKRFNACLYLPQLIPIADFRLVYSGSRSMRWTVLEAFAAFVDNGGGAPFALESDRDAGVVVVIASGRLSAAGSISIPGIAGIGSGPAGVAPMFYGRRRRIRTSPCKTPSGTNLIDALNEWEERLRCLAE